MSGYEVKGCPPPADMIATKDNHAIWLKVASGDFVTEEEFESLWHILIPGKTSAFVCVIMHDKPEPNNVVYVGLPLKSETEVTMDELRRKYFAAKNAFQKFCRVSDGERLPLEVGQRAVVANSADTKMVVNMRLNENAEWEYLLDNDSNWYIADKIQHPEFNQWRK